MPARTDTQVRARVLLLGSNSPLDRDLVTALRVDGSEVILATDRHQALDIVRTERIDILMLDFDTQAFEFEQLAARFGSAHRRCRTLVLASSLEQLALASEVGADGLLMKPLDPDRMRNVIYNLLDGVRSEDFDESRPADTLRLSEVQPSNRCWGINE